MGATPVPGECRTRIHPGPNLALGIPALDRALMDGVPPGSLVMVTGEPGAGMELFAKQVASAGTEPSLYVATEETADEVRATMARFDWSGPVEILDVLTRHNDIARRRKLAHLRRSRAAHGGPNGSGGSPGTPGANGTHAASGARGTNGGTGAPGFDDPDGDRPTDDIPGRGSHRPGDDLLAAVARRVLHGTTPRRVVVDNLDLFLDEHGDKEVLSMLRAVKQHNRRSGGLVLCTLTEGVLTPRSTQRLEANADIVVRMEMRRSASEFELWLIVKKVLNHPNKARMFLYGITDAGITPEMVVRVS